MPRKPITAEQIEKIKDLTARKYGPKEIGAIAGIHPDTVRKYQKRLGIKNFKEHFLTQDQVNKIMNMSIHRYTQDRIAKEVGCSIHTVRHYQQLNELPASNRDESSGKAKRFETIKKEVEKKMESASIPVNKKPVELPVFSPTLPVVKRASTPTDKPAETENKPASNPIDKPAENKPTSNPPVKPAENKLDSIPPVKPAENKPGDWINVVAAAITISGNKTGFTYSVALDGKEISIDTGYSEPLKIDMQDLASFGNELIDIAEKITQMRKNLASF